MPAAGRRVFCNIASRSQVLELLLFSLSISIYLFSERRGEKITATKGKRTGGLLSTTWKRWKRLFSFSCFMLRSIIIDDRLILWIFTLNLTYNLLVRRAALCGSLYLLQLPRPGQFSATSQGGHIVSDRNLNIRPAPIVIRRAQCVHL